MTSGRAHGENREYQLLCRNALQRFQPTLKPYSGDGIDVPFDVGGTTWTLDVALKTADGNLVMAECRRRREPLKQENLASFAYKVELLRKRLGIKVAGVIFTRKHTQVGAVKAATWAGIEVATCEQGQPLDALSLVFHSYDAERNERLRKGEVYAAGKITPSASLTLQVIHRDGTKKKPIKAK